MCVFVAHIIIRGRTHTFRVSFFPSGVHFPKVEGVRFLGLMRKEKSSCGRWGNSAFIFTFLITTALLSGRIRVVLLY